MKARYAAALALLLPHFAGHAADYQINREVADCFTIYNAANEPVLRSTRTPVDLSKPISAEMARKFPGYHMVWTRNTEPCHPLVIAVNGESKSRALEEIAQAMDEGAGELLVDGVFTATAAGRPAKPVVAKSGGMGRQQTAARQQ